jgi:hypothetical protein
MASDVLRTALGLVDDGPLLLPDCGEKTIVAARYKGIELAFVVDPDACDEAFTAPLLRIRDIMKELAHGE